MSESMVVDHHPMICSSEAWGRVRWTWRMKQPVPYEPASWHPEAERLLQQEVQITDYRDGERIGIRTEWRDVDFGPAEYPQPKG